jgi:hypothetical protein
MVVGMTLDRAFASFPEVEQGNLEEVEPLVGNIGGYACLLLMGGFPCTHVNSHSLSVVFEHNNSALFASRRAATLLKVPVLL